MERSGSPELRPATGTEVSSALFGFAPIRVTAHASVGGMPTPPKIPALVLPPLRDSDDARLDLDGSLEGARFTGLDLGERDFSDAAISDCEFSGTELSHANLRGASLVDVRLTTVAASVLSAPRSRFRNVQVTQSRIGAGELYESELNTVVFEGCKLGFLNLRGAKVVDVRFVDCRIDELDLGGASVTRLSLVDCQVGTLDVAGARLADVDLRGADLGRINGVAGLRGATIDEVQLSQLAALLADNLGFIVE